MFNEVQDRAVNVAEVRRYRYNRTSRMWGQVKIGEARILEREFVFVDGESEATIFPGKCTYSEKDKNYDIRFGVILRQYTVTTQTSYFSVNQL